MEDKALEVIKTMLINRKFKITEHEVVGNPLDETRMYTMDGVLIIFSEKSRLTEPVLNTYISFAEEGYKNGTIIVTLIQPSDTVISLIRDYNSDLKKPFLQIFDIRHIQFDISTHRKVPPHRIITTEELALLEKKMNITNSKKQLPWIDSQDAMAKWIGARDGDVVEILRFSESAGTTPYYRYCVGNVMQT